MAKQKIALLVLGTGFILLAGLTVYLIFGRQSEVVRPLEPRPDTLESCLETAFLTKGSDNVKGDVDASLSFLNAGLKGASQQTRERAYRNLDEETLRVAIGACALRHGKNELTTVVPNIQFGNDPAKPTFAAKGAFVFVIGRADQNCNVDANGNCPLQIDSKLLTAGVAKFGISLDGFTWPWEGTFSQLVRGERIVIPNLRPRDLKVSFRGCQNKPFTAEATATINAKNDALWESGCASRGSAGTRPLPSATEQVLAGAATFQYAPEGLGNFELTLAIRSPQDSVTYTGLTLSDVGTLPPLTYPPDCSAGVVPHAAAARESPDCSTAQRLVRQALLATPGKQRAFVTISAESGSTSCSDPRACERLSDGLKARLVAGRCAQFNTTWYFD
jgi:hypothetical protein